MDFVEETQTLVHLGLTQNQARAYFALLRSSISTAKDISRVSGITRQDIYRVMPALEGLSLVERLLTTPIMYKAIPLQECLTILFENRTKENRNLQTEAKVLLRTFKMNGFKENFSDEKPQFKLVPQKEVINLRADLIAAATNSIDVVTSLKKQREFFLKYAPMILKAVEKGVRIRTVVEKTENDAQVGGALRSMKDFPNFEIRCTDAPPEALVTVYDDKEVLMLTSAITGFGQAAALRSTNLCMVKLAQEYFETMWLHSTATNGSSCDRLLSITKQT